MLDADELPAAEKQSQMFADTKVPQLWDGEKRFGREVSKSLSMADRAAWDVYLFYPPGAEWTDAGLPPADKALAQANGAVIGLKGTLPPSGDQSKVPDWGAGRVDVVGKPEELATLLSAIAVPYVERAGAR